MHVMEDSIQIQVNGEQRGCRVDATVGDLLRELAIKTERVAVELNLEIMDRKDFDHRSLKQGDRLEILSFIGGGSMELGRRRLRRRFIGLGV
jgi:thiamine biosynthesis protein ThiS